MTHALIIGGGIAGAVTALSLQKAGITSTVYEAYPAGADDIGAFLTIMGNGLDALNAVGLREVVVDNSFAAESVRTYDASGTEIGSGPADGRTLRRSDLYRALHGELGRRGGRLEHGKRLVSATTAPTGRVTATFQDGSTADGDLLIGADGIRSTVRGLIDSAAPTPRYTGLNIFYGYAHDPGLPDARDAYHMIFGSGAFFGHTMAPDGTTWWFARLPAPELSREQLASATAAEWRERAAAPFAADATPAARIIGATGDEIDCRNAYDISTTPVWRTGSIVVVGDAAHAASPAAAQGASMAIEDSVVLAKCLRDLPTAGRAFAAYEGLRRERVEALVNVGARIGDNSGSGKPKEVEQAGWSRGHHIDWNTPITD